MDEGGYAYWASSAHVAATGQRTPTFVGSYAQGRLPRLMVLVTTGEALASTWGMTYIAMTDNPRWTNWENGILDQDCASIATHAPSYKARSLGADHQEQALCLVALPHARLVNGKVRNGCGSCYACRLSGGVKTNPIVVIDSAFRSEFVGNLLRLTYIGAFFGSDPCQERAAMRAASTPAGTLA